MSEQSGQPEQAGDSIALRAQKLGQDLLEDVGLPFTQEALDLAAELYIDAPDAFERLAEDVKASNANTNEWRKRVRQRSVELRAENRRNTDPRPTIEDTDDIPRTVRDTFESLASISIYQRGGELVEVVERPDGAQVAPVSRPRLRELMAEAARWERYTKDGIKPMKPPTAIVDVIHARGQWPFPELAHIVEGACFLADGEVLFREGYYPDHGIYVRHGADVDPARLASPTQEDAEAAFEMLRDLLVDFELDASVPGGRAAQESAWVACPLTILARTAIDGATPLHLMDANRPRTGKTRLGEMSVEITTGNAPTPQAAPAGRDSDSEMGKTITGIARAGLPVVFFDNVKGKLGGASLELAITAKNWSGRILGESRQYQGRLQVTWIATSNNAQLTPDMHGRTLICRIKSDHEAPEERTGFTHPYIMRHIREHRRRYLTALLVILRAWHLAGRPSYELTPWGSFEEWGQIIRHAIIFAGGVDPCLARQALEDADSETRAMKSVLSQWPEGVSYTSSDLAKGMKDGSLPNSQGMSGSHGLVDALQEALPTSNARGISYALGSWKGRVVDGRELVREKDRYRDVYVWAVRGVG